MQFRGGAELVGSTICQNCEHTNMLHQDNVINNRYDHKELDLAGPTGRLYWSY